MCCWLGFPVVRLLSSIPSATGGPVLFGDFTGTTSLSDFPCPSIIGVRPWTSRDDPQLLPLWVDMGSPGSHARCLRTCTGSLTAQDPVASRAIDALGGAFRFLLQRRRPGGSVFRGSIPGPHVPLSTLRRHPLERLRMTRGRCGSLRLHRMTLSFTTPRRFSLAHRSFLDVFARFKCCYRPLCDSRYGTLRAGKRPFIRDGARFALTLAGVGLSRLGEGRRTGTSHACRYPQNLSTCLPVRSRTHVTKNSTSTVQKSDD